jgi:hypothetical protein
VTWPLRSCAGARSHRVAGLVAGRGAQAVARKYSINQFAAMRCMRGRRTEYETRCRDHPAVRLQMPHATNRCF